MAKELVVELWQVGDSQVCRAVHMGYDSSGPNVAKIRLSCIYQIPGSKPSFRFEDSKDL